MTTTEKINELPGAKHWLYQLIPPLLMLAILFTTNKGPALVFLAGIFIIPVLFSLISIIAKLIYFKKKKYFLPRPVLTIAIFILILSIAHWTYSVALEQAISTANIIHEQCNQDISCPENPAVGR